MRHLARCSTDRFAALARVCERDPLFPRSETEWHALVAKADVVAIADGGLPPAVSIEPEDFAQWCAMVAIVPGLDALKAYAIVRRAQVVGTPVESALSEKSQPST
jgi:hypothetical protein